MPYDVMKSILDVQFWLYNRWLSEMVMPITVPRGQWFLLMLLDYVFDMESY